MTAVSPEYELKYRRLSFLISDVFKTHPRQMTAWGLAIIIAEMRADVGHQSHNAVVNPWNYAGISTEIPVTEIVRIWWRRRRDSNPRDDSSPTPLAGERLRPLGHISENVSKRLIYCWQEQIEFCEKVPIFYIYPSILINSVGIKVFKLTEKTRH